MAVTVVDPNKISTNELENSIPKYEDMTIYVKLSAETRGRTVLVVNDKLKINESETKKYSADGISITNFIHYNSNDNGENSFGTNYVENNVSNPDDSFGIQEIKMVTNSSYIPQVNIKFLDIRGASFFNNENSPYRILFDFPPPIFELTVKGYYGKGLIYKLHLTKYTTEFLAESGNYVIDAQFVAVTFAPLADIPLRYVTQFGYIDSGLENSTNNANPVGEPKTTNELILRAEKVAGLINTEINKSNDKNNLDKVIEISESTKNCIEYVNGLVNGEDSPLLVGGKPVFKIGDYDLIKQNKNPDFKPVGSLTDYQSILKSGDSIFKGLFITYDIVKSEMPIYNPQKNAIDDNIKSINENILSFGINNKIKAILITYKNDDNTDNSYYSMDVTGVAKELLKKNIEIESDANKIKKRLNDQINSIIHDKLGITPTISNIFKILLDDVDHFFDVLRKTSIAAEIHHQTYKSQILGNTAEYVDTFNDVYSFPLIIQNGNNDQKKIAPVDFARNIRIPEFPEITLVNKFIESFDTFNKNKKTYDAKINLNESGNNKWIPFSPLDSAIEGSENPYSKLGLDNKAVNFKNLLYVFLKRYYVLKQYSFSNSYDKNDKNKIELYNNLFAKSEAANLIESCDKKTIALINTQTKDSDINFEQYLNDPQSNDFKELYELTGDIVNTFPTINKKSDEFNKMHSVKIEGGIPEPRNEDKNENDPINIFIDKSKGNWYKFYTNSDVSKYYSYTKDNLIYLSDSEEPNYTRFLRHLKFNDGTGGKDLRTYDIAGNLDLQKYTSSIGFKKIFNQFYDITDSWSYILDQKTPTLRNILTNKVPESGDVYFRYVRDLFIFSNFGDTASPFSTHPTNLNNEIFGVPAKVCSPDFLPMYMGLIATIAKTVDVESNTQTLYEYMKNFFINGSGKEFLNKFSSVFADIYDVNNYMSLYDRNEFYNYYNKRIDEATSEMDAIYDDIENLYSKIVYKSTDANGNITYKTIDNAEFWASTMSNNVKSYRETLNESKIFQKLMDKVTIVNNTSLSFKMVDNLPTTYASLSSTKDNKDNVEFFKTFMLELNKLSNSNITQEVKEDLSQLQSTNDIDVLTETYYSFKNINDKWLAGNTNTNGFPFIENGKTLFNQFRFVDRAMNNIGDVAMINPETLATIFNNDTDISVFSAISQLLSLNGFEFFPLQNFITTDQTEKWKDSFFKINISNDCIESSPVFVCMYVGGSSSYPIMSADKFKNDGITDFQTQSASDFDKNDHVKAFKVKFAQQAQSHFSNIKIDSKEYPETNESIQILSRLAGDGKQRAAIPKGQNLYNLYENRSYKATITGLGNVMIQPTQYFQLENVPLYNGAYIILSVEHLITPNTMVTSFSGTKILRYPKPIVTSPAVLFDINIGDSIVTGSNDSGSNQNITTQNDSSQSNANEMPNTDVPIQMQNNSMFTFGTGIGEFVYTYKNNVGEDIENVLTNEKGTKDFITKTFKSGSKISGNRSYTNGGGFNDGVLQVNTLPKGVKTYILPFSNVTDEGKIYQSQTYKTNDQWLTDLPIFIAKYSKMYNIDPNVITAQIYHESGFNLSAYSSTGSLGITQFLCKTIHGFIVKNKGTGEDFTQAEINKILVGLPAKAATDSATFSNRENRMQVFQNCMDNPDLLIKAQCRYMKTISLRCNNLLSSTLLGYNRGDQFAKKSFFESYDAAKTYKAGYENEGIEYVKLIWNTMAKNMGSGYSGTYKFDARNFDVEIAKNASRILSSK